MNILVNQTIVQHKPLLTILVDSAAGRAKLPCIHQADDKSPAACGFPTKSAIDKSATTMSVQDDANRRQTPK